MSSAPIDPVAISTGIKQQILANNYRLTLHANLAMAEEEIAVDDLIAALSDSMVLENYPLHQRGACCLVAGQTSAGRNLHVVCTTAQPQFIIITVYEPKPPKWPTPLQRGP
jgi:hypothetical protein